MSRIGRILASGTTLVFALILSTDNATARNFYDDAAIKKDIDALVELLKGDKVDDAKVKTAVADIKKKYDDLNDLMKIYKPTAKKGLGWNPAKPGKLDGIEQRINDLGTKKVLTKAQMAKEKELILRATYYNLALYEITKGFAPDKIKGGKGPNDWKKHNDEIMEGSKEVIAAVKANDPVALKKAMGRIGGGCTECHADFRDR